MDLSYEYLPIEMGARWSGKAIGQRLVAGPRVLVEAQTACAFVPPRHHKERAKIPPRCALNRPWQRRLGDLRRGAARWNPDSVSNVAPARRAAQQRIPPHAAEFAALRGANLDTKSLPGDACGRKK